MAHTYHESPHVQYCSKVKSLLERWWIRYGIGPIFLAAPAGLVTFYMSDKPGPRDFAAHFMPSVLTHALDENHILAYSFPFVWVYVWTLIYGLIDWLAKKRKVDVGSLLFLHQTLEAIVESKAHRFGDYVKYLGGKKQPATLMFNDITKPEQQIALLAHGIHSFFSYLYPHVGIRVGVNTIEKNVPQDWLYWVPESKPARSSIESLRNKNSTLSTCLQRREMVIVEDTLLETRNQKDQCFVLTREGVRDAQCSLICEPIIDGYTGDIPYVVNIAADKKGVFLEKYRDLYQWMLGPFALRMRLEHSLLTIKKSQEVNHAPEKSMV